MVIQCFEFQVKQASFTYWFFGTGWAERHSSFDEYTVKPTKQVAKLNSAVLFCFVYMSRKVSLFVVC
ncbi:unnamed protein product [Brugia timori]|uniref:Ovule protein n=1 Tax=Brugia timori TaxID=42155 RepID=A0A0R3QRZ9_9BILA|nr:unnamed protein product [Brugia timori]